MFRPAVWSRLSSVLTGTTRWPTPMLLRQASIDVQVKNDAPRDKDAPIQMKNPFERESKQCILCKLNITPDYKNVRLLSQFQSSFTGRLYERHITGLCKRKQKQVKSAMLKAQIAGLMPFYHKHLPFMKDPKLFDPERPLRPHSNEPPLNMHHLPFLNNK